VTGFEDLAAALTPDFDEPLSPEAVVRIEGAFLGHATI
jgi:hypothetical protein